MVTKALIGLTPALVLRDSLWSELPTPREQIMAIASRANSDYGRFVDEVKDMSLFPCGSGPAA